MRAVIQTFALVLLAVGCGRSGVGEPADGSVDGGAALVDASPDAGPPMPTDGGPRPPRCVGRDDVGAFLGSTPIGEIAFPFVVAGIEGDGTHSCPRLFVRAGDEATFSGSRLEIEVPMPPGEREPGPRMGTMTVLIAGREWIEPVRVDVQRADGLFDTSRPRDEWRARVVVSHHDATTDLEGHAADAEYCNDFPLCL